MKCKHFKPILDCFPCYDKVLRQLIKSNKSKSYANMFTNLQSSIVVRTLTSDELFPIPIAFLGTCIEVPLTSSCDDNLFKLGKCKSPSDAWCKVQDKENKFITSIQIPKCCDGCYSFDLSATVGLTGIVQVPDPSVPTTLNSFTLNLSANITLKLSEQVQKGNCFVESNLVDVCYTSLTLPILDTPKVTELNSTFLENLGIITLLGLVGLEGFSRNDTIKFTNLAVSGIVCLRGCQRLVPSLTIQLFNFARLLRTITPGLTIPDISNVKVHLSNLSIKLVRIGECNDECESCKKKT